MKQVICQLTVALILFLFVVSINEKVMAQAAAPVAGACTSPTVILKLATLAPEGTSLYKGLAGMKSDIKAKTNGCVDIHIFGGGQMGDEVDVVKKTRMGQLDGGALTGRGLSEIVPEVRVLEVPFLFNKPSQIDLVYNNPSLKKEFEDKFAAKNFLLLGWAEAGLVQLFSTKPIAAKKDLEGRKVWVWTGDEFANTFLIVLKLVAVPLAITDVQPSLQTGLIDTVYGPPLAAMAFQWPTVAKYMSKIDIVNATGGLVLSKAGFDKLTPPQQAIVKQSAEEATQKLVTQSRADNQSAILVMQSSGVQVINPSPESLAELKATSKEIQSKLVGIFFPQELLNRINALIATAP